MNPQIGPKTLAMMLDEWMLLGVIGGDGYAAILRDLNGDKVAIGEGEDAYLAMDALERKLQGAPLTKSA